MAKNENISIYFNLLKTVIGCGMLAYPMLIKKYGTLPVILFSTFSATFSSFGLILYSKCNQIIGKKSTMSSISKYIMPKLRIIIDICVSLKCFGVGTLYILILKKLIAAQREFLIDYLNDLNNVNDNLILLVLMLLSAPLSFFDKLKTLRFTSLLGIISIFIILISNTIMYFKTTNHHKLTLFTSDTNYLENLGDFVYGFTCHQNIFTIQNEMPSNRLSHLIKIVIAVMISSILIYFYFGIINYRIFGDKTELTILTLYIQDKSFLSFGVIFLFSLMIIFSFPLQSNPCRLYTLNLFNLNGNKTARIAFTCFLLVVTYLLVICNFEVEKILGFIGSTVSSAMCFIFCSIFYLKMKRKELGYKIMAMLALGFGCFVTFVFIFTTIKKYI